MSDRNDTSQPQPQKKAAGFVLVGVLLPLCWLGMMVVHEAGHVTGAALTGGRVVRVVLHPLAISRTDVEPNPNPHLVAWAGPVIGLLLPVVLWSALRALNAPAAFLARFFAGFCAVANGLYLGVGSFERIGDAGDLLRSGASLWHLWLFGALATLGGGPHLARRGEAFRVRDRSRTSFVATGKSGGSTADRNGRTGTGFDLTCFVVASSR